MTRSTLPSPVRAALILLSVAATVLMPGPVAGPTTARPPRRSASTLLQLAVQSAGRVSRSCSAPARRTTRPARRAWPP